jgi:undecaprenyl-diphosphatase
MSFFQAVILAIVEGITEFLPVSSTGHMIIVSSLMGINEQEFTKLFTVNIQFGTILSVLVLYYKRFLQSFEFYLKLFVAFIPAAVLGLLLNDLIDFMLGSVLIVAIMLVLGGIILLFVDKWFHAADKPDRPFTYPEAFKVGLFQCIAMVPGVSRSAATIIGGLTQGVNRKSAAEFSFFLAVPTMFAAGAYKLHQSYELIRAQDIQTLVVGNVVGFLVAMVAIKFFITFVTKYGFRLFGFYRIAVGLTIIILMLLGYDLEL